MANTITSIPQLDPYSEKYNKGYWGSKSKNKQIEKNLKKDVKEAVKYFSKYTASGTLLEDITIASGNIAPPLEPYQLIKRINKVFKQEDKIQTYRMKIKEKIESGKIDGRTKQAQFYSGGYVVYRLKLLYGNNSPIYQGLPPLKNIIKTTKK